MQTKVRSSPESNSLAQESLERQATFRTQAPLERRKLLPAEEEEDEEEEEEEEEVDEV